MPFQISTARTCQEAVVYLSQDQFGIVLCERNLPDGTWVDLLDQTLNWGEGPLLIVTSRLADESLWVEVLNLGGFDLLAKPFRQNEVRHVVTSAWVQKQNPVRRTRAAGAV
jgi:DNA-binding response OmpR family regulator